MATATRNTRKDQTFTERGIAFVTEAIKEDNRGNYSKAKGLYEHGLEAFMLAIKYEKNPHNKQKLIERANGYMERAEQLKKYLTEQASANGPLTSSSVEMPAPNAEHSMDVEAELARVVGQGKIKQQIEDFRKQISLDVRRRELGFDIGTTNPPHMMFLGNPGTGKTTMARIVAEVLRQLGLVSKGHLVEVQRADLVGQHIGETAIKTRKVIESAKGGVLFVDEAYRLVRGVASGGGSNDFGLEAVNEIMSHMDGDPVMIFAGYQTEMNAFVSANPGLFRRISQQFSFADYTPLEIAEIFLVQVGKNGFSLDKNLTKQKIGKMIEANTSEPQRALFNGGLAAQMFTHAKQHLDRRLNVHSKATDLCKFLDCDVLHALQALPKPVHLNDGHKMKNADEGGQSQIIVPSHTVPHSDQTRSNNIFDRMFSAKE